ncbi:MFS transporter [Plasticicumulans lactativorans]|nr:MFS transporter [Plasticicumulans lactativorans]
MSAPPEALAPVSAWAPLRHPVFRLLWVGWLSANVCMWMNDVAAAWLMTSLSPAPVMVALVQTASTLPVFLLGLPSGALADILDRRRYFIATQFWVAAVAAVLCTMSFLGLLTPALLLALTFANGVGLAMRWPVFAALVPELVPRRELPVALALNGIAMNASRIFGPLVAGALIASAGSTYVFVLNAVLSLTVGLSLLRWQREHTVSTLPPERLFGAIRVGVQYVRESPFVLAVMLRGFLFFLNAIPVIALLPLLVKRLPGGGAATYTVLMAAMGSGAIIAANFLPRLRQVMTRDQMVRNGTLLSAAATALAAFAPSVWVAVPALLAAGMAQISTANSLTVAAQLSLPDWVKARGMAIYQMAMMGGSAAGAALWGTVATHSDLRTALLAAAAAALLALLAARRLKVGGSIEDLTPAPLSQRPKLQVAMEPERGPVLTTIEYRIDPARAEEFLTLMRASRRRRLRYGARSWELFRDATDPSRYLEHFIDDSWVALLRHHERVTAYDVEMRTRRYALHLGDDPPLVTHFVAETVLPRR